MQDLDDVNRRIIQMLMDNGRKPYREISEQLGLSESTVRKRVSKLLKKSVISKFTIQLNPQRDGKRVMAFITIVPNNQSNIKEVADEISNYSEVSESFYMSGKCGILLKVEVASLHKLDEFIESIRETRGISEIESCIVLRVLKNM